MYLDLSAVCISGRITKMKRTHTGFNYISTVIILLKLYIFWSLFRTVQLAFLWILLGDSIITLLPFIS